MKNLITAVYLGTVLLFGGIYTMHAMEDSVCDEQSEFNKFSYDYRRELEKAAKHNPRVWQQYDIFMQNLMQACRDKMLTWRDAYSIMEALDFANRAHVKQMYKNAKEAQGQYLNSSNGRDLLGSCKDHKISWQDASFIMSGFAKSDRVIADQMLKEAEQLPHIINLISVADSILSLGKVYDAAIIMGGLLHNTLQDTQTTFEALEDKFGRVVAQYVREVTDDKTLAKEERKCLQIEHATHASVGAAIIKLSDKLYNLKNLKNNPSADWSAKRIAEYFDWAQAVVNNLPKANDALKNEVGDC